MRKFVALFIASLFTSTAAMAQDAATPAIQGPRISVEQPEFDFGAADSDATIEHTFIIRNIGDTTLEIANVRPACGCTVADLSDKMVPPGGESRLTARLSLRGRSGRQSKAITITSNDPQQPQYRLLMSGNVTQTIQVAPDRLIFGQMSPGQVVTLHANLKSMTDRDFQITKIETNYGDLISTAETVAPGKEHRISATLTAPDRVGPINAILRVTTDHPDRPTIDIPVAANVAGELVYAPSEIMIPGQAGDAPQTRYVVVRKGTLPEFQVKEVITPHPDMTTRIFPFGDQGYRIQIENIKASGGIDGQEVRIITSAETMSEIVIPFRVTP